MPLIHSKQIRPNTFTENLLFVTGSSATNGQVLTYDAGSGGFAWVNNTGGVTSVSGGTALDETTTTGDVVLNVRTDDQSIYVDSNNDITLGDPTNNNLISGGDYRFGGSLIVNGDFTVLGTATTVNTETLLVEDNIVTLNSTFTAGTPTVNAGIEVLRGDETTVQLRWNETNNWWEIGNPEGTGNTYNAILTTDSVESTDNALVVTQGTGGNADKLFLSIDESSLTGIPNSGLTNDSITIITGDGLDGGGTVALGGTLTLSATSVTETLAQTLAAGNASGGNDINMAADDAINFGTASIVNTSPTSDLDFNVASTGIFSFTDSGPGGYDIEIHPSSGSIVLKNTISPSAPNTEISSGGEIKYNVTSPMAYTGVIDMHTQLTTDQTWQFPDDTGTVALTKNISYVTGGTYNAGTTSIDYVGTGTEWMDFSVDLSSLSASLSGDTFVDSGSVAYTNEEGTLTLTKNDATPVTITGFTDINVVSGVYSGSVGTLIFTKNNGDTFNVTGLDSNDTYVTGGTITTTPSNNSKSGEITLSYNNDEGGTYTLPFQDIFITGGTLSGTNLVLDRNDGTPLAGIDLSGLDSLDTFVTGGTVSNGSLTLNLNDGSTTTNNITGTIIQSVTGDSPITASTTNGAVTVGIDYSSIQLAVPTTADKSLTVTGTTSGNGSNTGLSMTNEPINDGYVKVEVNGVGYEVLGTTGGDSYFSNDGCGTAVAVTGITSGSIWCWNGGNVGFEIDSSDRVDFFYDVLQ